MRTLQDFGAADDKETTKANKADARAERRTYKAVRKSLETPEPEFDSSKLHSGQLEYMTLVNVLADEDLRSRLWPRLLPDHFFSESARAIFGRMTTLMRAGRDVPSLVVLAADPTLPESSKALLTATLNRVDRGLSLTRTELKVGKQTINAEEPGDYESLVFDFLDAYRINRAAVTGYAGAVERLSRDIDPMNGPNYVEEVATKALGLRKSELEQDVLMHVGHLTTADDDAKRFKRIKKLFSAKKLRFPTGFADYDRGSGGLQPGEVMVVGANSGGGKTAFMLTMMVNMLKLGVSTAMLQLELGQSQIDERLTANIANVDGEAIRTGAIRGDERVRATINDAWEELNEIGKINKSRLTVYSPHSATLEACEMMFKKYPYRVWFIDYINLMPFPGIEQDWLKLSELTKAFKALAKKHGIAVVLAAQVNIDKDSGEIDVRYSRAIKEHSDIFIGWNLDQTAREAGCVWAKHIKARQYEPFDFAMSVELKFARFGNYTEGPQADNGGQLGNKKFEKGKQASGGKAGSGGGEGSGASSFGDKRSRKASGEGKKRPQDDLAAEIARGNDSGERVSVKISDLVKAKSGKRKAARADDDEAFDIE